MYVDIYFPKHVVICNFPIFYTLRIQKRVYKAKNHRRI